MIGDVGLSFFPSAGREMTDGLEVTVLPFFFLLFTATPFWLSLYLAFASSHALGGAIQRQHAFFGTTTRARLRSFLFSLLFIKAAIMISAFD